MGIMVRERAAQESALMEQGRAGDYLCGALIQPEPQLPCGWEKCLDLKSGLIYFKDWNSGTLTYRDPRQSVVSQAQQRIGLLSISMSPEKSNASVEGASMKKFKRSIKLEAAPAPQRLPWTLSTTDRDSSATETTTATPTTSVNDDDDDHSLELSLNLPGTSRVIVVPPPAANSNQEESVCTMEKVQRALERSNWLKPGSSSRLLPKKRSSGNNLLDDTLLLLSSRASSSRESNSPRLQAHYSGAHESASSPSTSQCSDSECFTSPSVMSFEGGDEPEVQQQREQREPRASAAAASTSSKSLQTAAATPASDDDEVMVTVGCKSCLMYVMLSKAHPCCPKCGNTSDVLLELPAPAAPLPTKKQRLGESSSPAWSWCTA